MGGGGGGGEGFGGAEGGGGRLVYFDAGEGKKRQYLYR